jgi:predicted nucleic acid-binding protein
MGDAERFIDTNVLLYLLSADVSRADRAEEELAAGGVVSVQVLNEFAAVATRKLGLSLADVREVLGAVRSACAIVPITEETHDLGLQIVQRHRVSIWDAMILAAAKLAGCTILVTEDMQHGQVLSGLRLRNPFR